MRTNPSELAQIFDAELRENEAETLYELGPRYNVAPTQPIPVIVQRDDGRAFEMHRWGIVPSWSASMASAGARYINARGETVATSPVFRNSFLRRRWPSTPTTTARCPSDASRTPDRRRAGR